MKRKKLIMQFLLVTVTVLLSAIFSCQVTQASPRVALVIGNSQYRAAPLKNPVNDALDMARSLERAGFSVELLKNGNQRQMDESIQAFGKTLQKGGVGLFYFAGHGIQYHGRNYLIPVDARIQDESDVKYEAVDAGRILAKMELAGNDLNIVILDACRNNPFARSFRSAEQGLAQMEAPAGSFVAYATSPGSVAADGPDHNGLYTKYLLQYMDEPGIAIEHVFKKVRRAVRRDSDKKQTPWENSSLVGNFYFYPEKAGQPTTSSTAPVSASDYKSTLDEEEELWLAVRETSDPAELELYLQQYPQGRFATVANLKARKLRQGSEKPSHSNLTVHTNPADALVRILNISPQYSPGMVLSPGRYQVEVSAQNYTTETRWVTLAAGKDVSVEFNLNPVETPSTSPTFQVEQDTVAGSVPREILARGKLRVGLEPGYMPFELTDKKGQIIGFDVDLAKKMAEAMGVRLELVSTAWDGIIPALLTNKFDIILSGMTITEQRAQSIDFVPYFTSGQTMLIPNKLASVVQSYKDLNKAKYTVASKLGTTGEQTTKKMIPKAQYLSYETEQEGVLELINGKVDAFIYDLPFNTIASLEKWQGRVTHLDTPIIPEIYGIALRKGQPEFKAWLKNFMTKTKTTGVYETIHSKWFKDPSWVQEVL